MPRRLRLKKAVTVAPPPDPPPDPPPPYAQYTLSPWGHTKISDLSAAVAAIPDGATVTVDGSSLIVGELSLTPTKPRAQLKTLKPGNGSTSGGVTQGTWDGLIDGGYGSWQELDWYDGVTVHNRSAVPQKETVDVSKSPVVNLATPWMRRINDKYFVIVQAVWRDPNELLPSEDVVKLRVYANGAYVDLDRSDYGMWFEKDARGNYHGIEGFAFYLDAPAALVDRPAGGRINLFVRAIPINSPGALTHLIGTASTDPYVRNFGLQRQPYSVSSSPKDKEVEHHLLSFWIYPTEEDAVYYVRPSQPNNPGAGPDHNFGGDAGEAMAAAWLYGRINTPGAYTVLFAESCDVNVKSNFSNAFYSASTNGRVRFKAAPGCSVRFYRPTEDASSETIGGVTVRKDVWNCAMNGPIWEGIDWDVTNMAIVIRPSSGTQVHPIEFNAVRYLSDNDYTKRVYFAARNRFNVHHADMERFSQTRFTSASNCDICVANCISDVLPDFANANRMFAHNLCRNISLFSWSLPSSTPGYPKGLPKLNITGSTTNHGATSMRAFKYGDPDAATGYIELRAVIGGVQYYWRSPNLSVLFRYRAIIDWVNSRKWEAGGTYGYINATNGDGSANTAGLGNGLSAGFTMDFHPEVIEDDYESDWNAAYLSKDTAGKDVRNLTQTFFYKNGAHGDWQQGYATGWNCLAYKNVLVKGANMQLVFTDKPSNGWANIGNALQDIASNDSKGGNGPSATSFQTGVQTGSINYWHWHNTLFHRFIVNFASSPDLVDRLATAARWDNLFGPGNNEFYGIVCEDVAWMTNTQPVDRSRFAVAHSLRTTNANMDVGEVGEIEGYSEGGGSSYTNLAVDLDHFDCNPTSVLINNPAPAGFKRRITYDLIGNEIPEEGWVKGAKQPRWDKTPRVMTGAEAKDVAIYLPRVEGWPHAADSAAPGWVNGAEIGFIHYHVVPLVGDAFDFTISIKTDTDKYIPHL